MNMWPSAWVVISGARLCSAAGPEERSLVLANGDRSAIVSQSKPATEPRPHESLRERLDAYLKCIPSRTASSPPLM